MLRRKALDNVLIANRIRAQRTEVQLHARSKGPANGQRHVERIGVQQREDLDFLITKAVDVGLVLFRRVDADDSGYGIFAIEQAVSFRQRIERVTRSDVLDVERDVDLARLRARHDFQITLV